LEFNFC